MRKRLAWVAGGFTLFTGLTLAVNAQTVTEEKITFTGSTSLPMNNALAANAPAAPLAPGSEIQLMPEGNLAAARQSTITVPSPTQSLLLINPNPAPKTVVGPDPSFFGFPGLTHFDSRNASNGNQFSVEPPDQGLAIGNGYVLEAINEVAAVYDSASGLRLTAPIALNAFFGLPPAIIRGTPIQYGPSLSDPRAYYDHVLERWFVTVLEEDRNPNTNAPTGRTHLYIAVSTSSNPLLSFNIFTIDTTDDGTLGTPAHPGCPCFPDQPLIGADAHGFYISTNEYPIVPTSFNGAQIYALSKNLLAQGAPLTVVHFSGIPLAEAVAYTVQPALSLGFADEPESGVEYFLSALDFNNALDNRIAVWALLNTSSLTEAHPSLTLTHKILRSEVYGFPPPAIQPPGPMPLGMSLGEGLEKIESNDDRMQQVVYENGYLWSGLNTVVGGGIFSFTTQRAGIAYFVVAPSVVNNTLSAKIVKQGYLAAPGSDSVIFPSIGVNSTGKAAMTFTLVGPTPTPAFLFAPVFYPSMAFTQFDANNALGPIQLGAAGMAPEDGFSGYKFYGGDGVARWGDYSAAIADTDGSIWMAAEWIPGTPRTQLANWGTFIGKLPQ